MKTEPTPVASVSDAIRDFQRVANIADKTGEVILFMKDRPRYRLVSLDSSPYIEMSENERMDFVAARIFRDHYAAFLELAK